MSTGENTESIDLLSLAQGLCAIATELEKCVNDTSELAISAKQSNRTIRQQIAALHSSAIWNNYSQGQKQKLRSTFIEQNINIFTEALKRNTTDRLLSDFERENFVDFILKFVKNSERNVP